MEKYIPYTIYLTFTFHSKYFTNQIHLELYSTTINEIHAQKKTKTEVHGSGFTKPLV